MTRATERGEGEMCDRSHTYTIEVICGLPRTYTGTDEDEAISALLTIDPEYGEEGYAVAEHVEGDSTTYCPAESNRIDNAAIAARADMDRKMALAVEAFHGEGAYALTPPF